MSTLNDFEILDKIGSGTYGDVFKARFKRQNKSTEVRKLIVSHLSFVVLLEECVSLLFKSIKVERNLRKNSTDYK